MNMNIGHVGKDITDRQHDAVEKQARLPASSPCEIELTDADLGVIYGGSVIKNLENPLVHLIAGGKRPQTANDMNFDTDNN